MTRRRFFTLIALAAMLIAALGLWNATRMPVVRHGVVRVKGWPAGTVPVRVALISDIHVAGPDMPPERLRRIVARINALSPDLVLIAGDLISDRKFSTRRYDFAEAVAPLAGLKAPRMAVLGNHDHWRNGAAARAALAKAGVTVIDGRAFRFKGLTLIGLDDMYAGAPDPAVLNRRLPRPVVLLTHSAEVVRVLPPGERLVLAGHTHCGQIVLPFIGPLGSLVNGKRGIACGIVHRKGRDFVVTAGLGTSILPLRYGAPPDLWLISFVPAAPPQARSAPDRQRR